MWRFQKESSIRSNVWQESVRSLIEGGLWTIRKWMVLRTRHRQPRSQVGANKNIQGLLGVCFICFISFSGRQLFRPHRTPCHITAWGFQTLRQLRAERRAEAGDQQLSAHSAPTPAPRP